MADVVQGYPGVDGLVPRRLNVGMPSVILPRGLLDCPRASTHRHVCAKRERERERKREGERG